MRRAAWIWTRANRCRIARIERESDTLPADPLDDEGKRFAPLLPKAVGDLRKPGSDMRAIVGAIRQVARSGGA